MTAYNKVYFTGTPVGLHIKLHGATFPPHISFGFGFTHITADVDNLIISFATANSLKEKTRFC